jgi:ATP-dependent DNA helicase RecG
MSSMRLKESSTVELKKSVAQLNDALKTICAFLNHKGGTVYFGVDNSGKILGTQVSEKTLRKISQQICSRIKPETIPEIREITENSKFFIEVKISEGTNKPYFLDGKAYKKVGSEKRVIPPDELKKMILEQKKNRWDEEICSKAQIQDVDWEFVQKTFIPLYKNVSGKKVAGKPIDLLKALGAIKKDKPTNAGILLFGRDPSKYFPQSYIALGRYKGKAVGGEKLDYKEFHGTLFEQIDNCTKYIIEHTALMSRLIPGNVQRTDIPEYGLFSVRELITNAVCHRDYETRGGKIIIKMFDDRIEFYNIGSLPIGITPRNIAKEQFSRNPTIAAVLAKVKYIEEMGEGWDKIIEEHREHPLHPEMPTITSSKNSTLVMLFSTKDKFEEKRDNLTKRQREIIEYIQKNGRITKKECANLFNISDDTSLRELSTLKMLCLIDRKGVSTSTYYVIK